MRLGNIKIKNLIKLKPKHKTRDVKRIKVERKIDSHHCRCFSLSKPHFRNFLSKLQNLGYSEPFFEQDHKQIIGMTKRLSTYYQIHVKLMKTGRIEAEIEYPQDYPMAHLNPLHSYSAHAELNLLFSSIQIPYKCKRKPPITCVQRQIIPAQQPTHMDDFLIVGGVGALADLIFNDGKITEAVLKVVGKEVRKSIHRKAKRRKYL